MKNKLILISTSNDPYTNQAIETLLLSNASDYDHILYLWINRPTVVFGRNQNPWKEVAISAARSLDVNLLRRHSGGGTVYHDWGNLNYAFITSSESYDEKRNFEMIHQTLKTFGIEVRLGRRKDILYQDKKISGSAFYIKKGMRLHHGTLLIDVDTSLLWKVLRFDATAILAKSIPSVKSEIINLVEVNPYLTVEKVIDELSRIYAMGLCDLTTETSQQFIEKHSVEFHQLYTYYQSWDWIFGETPNFKYELVNDGYVSVRDGKIIDVDTFEQLKHFLGQPFEENKILCNLLKEV